MDNSKEHIGNNKERSLTKKLLRLFGWLMLLFVVLMIAITILFQSTRFQNWLGQKVTKKFSEDLNTTIHFDHIDFEIFDNLVLENFLLEDLNGDTLLHSQSLNIDINSSLWSLLWKNELEVNELDLNDAKFILKKEPGASKTNLDLLLAKIIKPKSKSKESNKDKNPFYIHANILRLNNVTFLQENKEKGEDLLIYVKKGIINVNQIDLVEKLIEIEKAELDGTKVSIEKFVGVSAPQDTTIVEEEEPDSLHRPFQILVHDLDFTASAFSLHDHEKAPKKTTPQDELDWDHFDAFDIQLAIDSLDMNTDLDFEGSLKKLAYQDKSGFVLNELSAKKAKVTSRRTELYGLKLETPNSTLGDTLIFKYRNYKGFKEFNDEVIMDAKFDKTRVAIKDIMVFAPKLRKNKFFANNANEMLELDGRIRGKVNSLKGKDLDIRLGKRTRIQGGFSSGGLANKGEEYLNFDLKKLTTSMQTLRQLIPEFNPPANYDRLGHINFSGSFTGFFVDFVAYGDLKTDLGRAVMDMRLDLKPGRDKANYSGNLNLQNFDLVTWTGNQNLGNITVTSKISNGIGLTASTANAKIDASVDNFTFKGYTYRDFIVDGKLNQNLFDGKFIIEDKNIDLSFDGSLDFQDEIPAFNFKANVNTLNLDELNLSKQDISIAGDVDLSIVDVNLSNLTGDASFRDLKITKDGSEIYIVDSLEVVSIFNEELERVFTLGSEIIDVDMEGVFDLQEVPDVFVNFMVINYPEISNKLGIKDKGKTLNSKYFDFDIHLKDSKNFTNLVDTKLDTIKNLTIVGSYDGAKYQLKMDLDVEKVTYDNIALGGIRLNGNALRGVGRLSSLVPFYAVINGKTKLPELSIDGKLNRDTVEFEIGVVGERGTIDRFNLGGKLFFEDGEFNISLANDSLILFGEDWVISENNFIQLSKNIFRADNFNIKNRDREVRIKSIADKGLHLNLDNFNTGFIDTIWDHSKLDFAGNYSVDVMVEDLYRLKGLNAKIVSDTFFINDSDYGRLELNASTESINDQLDVDLSIKRGTDLQELAVKGFYQLPKGKNNNVLAGELSKQHPDNYFDFDIDFVDYPLGFMEYFIGHIMSETQGHVFIDANVKGLPKQFDIAGDAEIFDGSTKVNYLNTEYYFGHNDKPTKVKITNTMFDFTGNTMYDKYNNPGIIEGGLTHEKLKHLGFNARMKSDEFLVLDTDKKDNPLYYGHGIGQVDIFFTGSANAPYCYVNATTGEGSTLAIPIDYGKTTSSDNFIIFKDKDGTAKTEEVGRDIRGLDLTINVNVTEAAEASLIFDEQAGDIIRGRGNGPLQLKVPRGGEMQLNGEYVVTEGTYLFTLDFLSLGKFINKNFKVRQGGTIRWSGDPFAAQLNIEAEYNRISAPVYNFIEEYIDLETDETKAAARKSTDVDLEMFLTGDLLKPDIKFGLSFPRIETGRVKNYVDNKIRSLSLDPNELNRQIFGLIVMGSFLPSGEQGLGGGESTLVSNTITEFLSSQLSIYFTGLLNEVLSDVDFISAVDFDVNYSVNDGDQIDDLVQGSELSLRLSTLLKDKWSIDGGYVRSNSVTGTSFNGGDFSIEFIPKADGRFRVRFFQEIDQALEGGQRNKWGIGARYRREFDSFNEFIDMFKKKTKENLSQQASNF